jgi:transcriptional regulator with XRE-family HTH domain
MELKSLKDEREALGLSLDDLAKQLHIPESTLAEIEQRETLPEDRERVLGLLFMYLLSAMKDRISSGIPINKKPENWKEIIEMWCQQQVSTISDIQQRDVEEFHRLADSWREQTSHLSSVSAIAMHPAYQQIIGMGRAALPLILRELEREPNHWFWALNAITKFNPVKQEQRGNLKEMSKAWLEWGKAQGYKW